MKKEKIIMLITAITSIFCVAWALTIPSVVMAVLLALNALFSLYACVFLLKDNKK
jgi:hypothetical protein